MKIAFFELEGWEEKPIVGALPEDEVFLSGKKLDEENLPAKTDFEAISVFIDSHVTEAMLDHFPKLKLLTTRSTGYDHLPIEACRKRGIAVAYVPGYGDNTVAEFAFGLILSLTRKLYRAIDQVKDLGSFSLEGLRGIDLKGKTLGVLGTGRIGKEAIRIGKGFGMEIVAYDLRPNGDAAKTLGFTYMPLAEVLARADVITIHCPLTDETKHLINKKNISLMKKGAYLVNTARGGIVETGALIAALQSGTLAGVGLDVLEEEGETKDEMKFLASDHPHAEKMKTALENHVLMKLPNVLITPHNAFNSQEALGRILSTTIENITAFESKKPMNLVP